jgi:hypothetical protein
LKNLSERERDWSGRREKERKRRREKGELGLGSWGRELSGSAEKKEGFGPLMCLKQGLAELAKSPIPH